MARKKAIPVAEYLKQHPTPVILHFQPTQFVEATTPEELREWEAIVRRNVGLKGLDASDAAGSYTGTKCGDPTGIDYFDDCESD